MRKLLKLGIKIIVLLVFLLILTNLLSQNNYFKDNYIKQIFARNKVDLSNDSKKQSDSFETEIPEVFKVDLGRPRNLEDDMDDRVIAQWEWVVNLSESNYMSNVKRKRLLVTTNLNGGFMLDEIDRNFICQAKGVNLSRFCEFVEDSWWFPMYRNYDEFDAVIARRDWVYQFYESKIPPSKKTFFSIQESPNTLFQGDFSVNNPMLASYWRGSDIVTPYYKWVPYSNNKNKEDTIYQQGKNYAEGKSKLAAIVVSHCPTLNDRLGFVEQLQKYIPIDVYGRCGPFKCPPKGSLGQNTCFDMVEEKYKFYLSFENANCRDYITEKFFMNAISRNIVPIVYGAHRKDYQMAAPPNSYIHVEDFPSPKELSDYLVKLDQNDDLYNEYFKWKGTGEIFKGGIDLFCRICAMLFYADFHPPGKWPKDSRWSSVNVCLPPGKFYWERN